MRQLLLAALSLTTLHITADACGEPPTPHVFRLSSHWIPGAKGADHERTFVVFDEAAPPAKLHWEQLAPMSYDGTQIAPASRLPSRTFTLVGAAGARVVASTKHVLLRRSWSFDQTMGGLEVNGGGSDRFSIALDGSHPDARWAELDGITATADDLAWIESLGITAEQSSIYVTRIHGTDFETVSVFPKDGTKLVTFLKQGTTNLGRLEGSPLGAYTVDHEMRLVVTGEQARTSTVFIEAV